MNLDDIPLDNENEVEIYCIFCEYEKKKIDSDNLRINLDLHDFSITELNIDCSQCGKRKKIEF